MNKRSLRKIVSIVVIGTVMMNNIKKIKSRYIEDECVHDDDIGQKFYQR